MKDEHLALLKSTGKAHQEIQHAVFDLEDIAREVRYLHPHLASDLRKIAKKIKKSRETIQGNASEMVNVDIKNSKRFFGEVFEVLLEKQ